MPRTCTICHHPQRDAIDHALVECQRGLRDIARQWRVSKDALARHKLHIPATLARAHEAQEVTRADDLLAGVIALRKRLEKALEGAQAAKDVASVARELRETLRLMLELEGRLRRGPQVQVAVSFVQSPEWARVQARIVEALARFPEARAAVVAAIEGMDADTAPSRALAGRAKASTAIVAAAAGKKA